MGVMEACAVEVGQAVAKGDVLMTLHNAEERAALAAAEKELTLAQVERDKVFSGTHTFEISAAESKRALIAAELDYARRDRDRKAALINKAISDTEFDLAKTDVARKDAALKSADAELLRLQHFVRPEDRKVADARIAVAKARLTLAAQRLEETFLRAPFNGVVFEILKREGESVYSVGPEPVLIFGVLSHLRVRAEIDENFAIKLRAGQQAIVFGRGLGPQQASGKVVLVKQLMGKKTVFSKAATERKDLDVVQALIAMDGDFAAPIGLEVDVKINVGQ
jgi:HlyD family secretion protein